jgi:type I restriction enzyme, R subunit
VQAFSQAVVDPAVTHQKLYSLTQAPTDRFNSKLKQLNEAIETWERAWRRAKADGDEKGMADADAQRSELTKERDALMVFSEGLNKFVRTYEYVAQLVDFGDPPLEGFASFARLLRKRLKGIAAEQVDLSDLKLTHFRVTPKGGLDGITPKGDPLPLDPMTDNGLRDAKDREKAYLSELVKRLNDAFGKEISDKDQVAFAVHVSEKLRDDAIVMAQVENNPKDQAMKANFPTAAVQAIDAARKTHHALATKLLSDEVTRGVFLDVVYELLRRDSVGGIFDAARRPGSSA